MRLRALLAPAAVSVLAFGPFTRACTPAPHQVDCAQRDENGDGYPDNGLSYSGTTFTCTYSVRFQVDAGYPVVFITKLCRGTSAWVDGPAKTNLTTFPDGDVKISAGCTGGFTAAFGNDGPS